MEGIGSLAAELKRESFEMEVSEHPRSISRYRALADNRGALASAPLGPMPPNTLGPFGMNAAVLNH